MWGNIVKMLKVMDLLARQNGATKKDIARITGKSDRQVYRILQAIEHIGIPIYNDRIDGEREKTWRIEESYLTKLKNLNVPDLSFTLPELFVLSFLKGSSSVFYESEIFKYVDSSFSKLKGLAPERLLEVFERMETVFLNRVRFAKNYSGHEDIMLDILEAIIGRKKCRISYHSFKSDIIRDYHAKPLHFFQENGGLYLLLHLDPGGESRTFALERIENVEITDEAFDYPSGFDAPEFLNRPFGLIMDDCFECRIWFSEYVAKYIRERRWAEDQRITENPDGSIILEMQTCGWPDVKRWVLSYGKDARVIDPVKMRQEILEEIAEMLKNNSI
ncbi:helix-turn-helix transcriptional regulator [Desulforegula conservatrix]|uniref:helix-turn-helix transcriptional regulator n=1 Tax=Desulforegula conservatrix TaxID=153026 RepID=UPI0004214C76|nr:WYL domain-containing transcriptional regulator [Desulforegula conservatrix]